MKKTGIMLVGIISGLVILGSAYNILMHTQNHDEVKGFLNIGPEPYEEKWVTVAAFDLRSLGEATPSGVESLFLATWGLNYTGCTPATDLAANHTSWSAALDNVSWYADADGFSEDCPSGEGWYFVVRVRWNRTHAYDDENNQWIGTNTRVNITTSGDETIAGTSGTLVESYNDSTQDFMWCNYYWDDSDNGYRVTADGSITISEIKLEAKY